MANTDLLAHEAAVCRVPSASADPADGTVARHILNIPFSSRSRMPVMKQFGLATRASGILLFLVGSLTAADPARASTETAPPSTVKATFLITGLHCPPCTSTVEQSLKSVKGVKSVKVDWATKNAKVEFDEQQIGAQQIAGRIASTSHMMGGTMQYGGWLALKVPDVTAEGNADKAKAALAKVKGVSTVAVYPQQKAVGVAFTAKGDISSAQLVEALKGAGLEASLLP